MYLDFSTDGTNCRNYNNKSVTIINDKHYLHQNINTLKCTFCYFINFDLHKKTRDGLLCNITVTCSYKRNVFIKCKLRLNRNSGKYVCQKRSKDVKNIVKLLLKIIKLKN